MKKMITLLTALVVVLNVCGADIVNETFSEAALPDGWAQAKYTKYLTTDLVTTSATAIVDTITAEPLNLALILSGSGSGDRGVAVTLPSSDNAEVVDINFDWFTGNPGTEANKMVELNLQDSLGNSILYFYAENWTGASNHIHCLNIDPTVNPGGAYRDVPLVAIAANASTLIGGADTALVVNKDWFNISARLNFAYKTIEQLTITISDTIVFTYKNLPFISELPNEFSRISAATFRNSSVNNDGTGTSGNGSNAYLTFQFDNFVVKEADINKPDYTGGYMIQKDTVFHPDYYYVMLGPLKEYFGNGLYYSYASGNLTAQGAALSTEPEYCWDITASETDGQFYIRNVGKNAYMSSFDGVEYSGITLAETPASFQMIFMPDSTVTQKGDATTQKTSGASFAEYAAFKIYAPASDRILIRGGTQWRKGQSAQTRCDFVEFFYGVPKQDVLKPILASNIDAAEVIAARTITEGEELFNLATGTQNALSQAISAAEDVDTTSWARMDVAINNLKEAIASYEASFVLPSDKYIIKVDDKFVTAAGTLSAVEEEAVVYNMDKVGAQVAITSGSSYLSMDAEKDSIYTDSVFFAFDPIIDDGKVMFLSNGDTLKTQDGSYWFSVSKFFGEVVALLKSSSITEGSTTADTSDIVIVFDQAVQILDATKITLNGVQATTVLNNDTLYITDSMQIKTKYTLVIEAGALSNAGKPALVIDSIGFSFTTFSPYLRDKQSMLLNGFGGVYALFGPGSGNGYTNTALQISSVNDSLYCGLNGLNESMWELAVLDSSAKTWSVKNFVNGKYLSYNVADSMLVFAETATPWQISLNASAPSDNDYMNVYTFWPAVAEADAFYDCAINVANMKVEKTIANGNVTTTAFRICPMESLTKADIATYSEDVYMTIGVRNDGRIWNQKGTTVSFDLLTSLEDPRSGYWVVLRSEDGRYTFKNALTGDYVTAVTDSTVLALPYNKELCQSWIIMDHCSKDGIYYYTVQGATKPVTCDQTACSGIVGLSVRNGGNAIGSQGLARIRFTQTAMTLVSNEVAPVVTVPTVTENAIVLNWTANLYAAAYQVTYAPVALMAMDSIKTDSIVGFVDSLATVVKTGDTLAYRITGLEKDAEYYYQVVALSAAGSLGTPSVLASASTVDFTQFAPPAPIAVDSLAEMKSVVFEWSANELAVSYVLTYSFNADMSNPTSVEVKELTYTVTNVPANTTVYATITLKSETESSSMTSAVGMATSLPYSVLIPETPVVEETSITNTSMLIKWPAAIDAVSYKLRVARSRTGVVNATPIDVTGVEYTATELTKNANYYITVQAVNANGDLSAQSEVANAKTANVDAIEGLDANAISVFAQSGVLYIQTPAQANISIYNVVGQKVRDIRTEEGLNMVEGLERGQIYLIRVQSNVVKITL